MLRIVGPLRRLAESLVDDTASSLGEVVPEVATESQFTVVIPEEAETHTLTFFEVGYIDEASWDKDPLTIITVERGN